MKKTISILISAALLVAAQGPVTEALAQVVAAPAGTAMPVAPVPGSFAMGMMGSASVRLGGTPTLTASLQGPSGLPAASIPVVQPAGLESRPALVLALPKAAAKPVSDPVEKKPSGFKKVVEAVKKAVGIAPKAKAEGPDYQGMLIQRVVAIADRLDAAETGKQGSVESLRAKGDGAWDNSYRPADPVEVPSVEGRSHEIAGLSPAREREQDLGTIGARAPPVPAGIDRALERAVGAAYNRFMDRLPGPARVALAAGLTVAVDLAAQTFMPGLFGFSPAAGFWVTAGLMPVVLPIVLADRLSLAKVETAAAMPLKRHEDGILGLLTGASVVSALGLAAGQVSLKSLLFSTSIMTTGLFPIAPFMGLLAAVASLPLLYSSGHVRWALQNRRIVGAKLPVPFLFKLLMLNVIVMPGRVFGMLLGNLMFPALASYASIATIVALWYGSQALLRMMARNASPEELAREKEYEKTPAKRGLLDPEPELGPDWRVLNTEAMPERAQAAVQSAQRRSAFWLAVTPAVSAALYALHHMSLSALVTEALPALIPHLGPALLFLGLSGLAVPLFSGTRRVTEGPLVDMVGRLSRKAGLPMPRVYEGKDPNGDPNAFAAGALHSLSVVAVIGAIRKLLSDRELTGVLGHELSHVKYRHVLTSFVAIVGLQIMAFNAATLMQAAIAMWAPVVWVLLFMVVSRANEDMADAGSALLLDDPRALATGLRKLELMGLLTKKVPDDAHSWVYRLFLNHPSVSDRVKALNRMMKEGA